MSEREIVHRFQVQPGLQVAVEDSLNILLVITSFDGSTELARSQPLSDGDDIRGLLSWPALGGRAEADAEQARMAGLREKLAASTAAEDCAGHRAAGRSCSRTGGPEGMMSTVPADEETRVYIVAAVNVPSGRFAELRADSEAAALGMARLLSAGYRRVAFGVAEIAGDGAYVTGVFLNGERRFTAGGAS